MNWCSVNKYFKMTQQKKIKTIEVQGSKWHVCGPARPPKYFFTKALKYAYAFRTKMETLSKLTILQKTTYSDRVGVTKIILS